jgi:peptidoglycan-associated lipoprotein
MRFNESLKIAVCGLVAIALCSGCGLFGKKKTPPSDILTTDQPLNIDSTTPPLAERTAEGTPVPSSEFQPENVLFSYDSYQIAETEIAKIEKVGEFLKKATDVKLVTEGHCDERGSNEYNMSLGEHRALAVRAYLVGLGIDGARIQTRSYGEEKPANPAHGEAAWRENRRVEFSLSR